MPATTILPLDDQRWRDFVDQHPHSTPFHDPAWAQLVADCYGFDAFAAALIGEDGEIRAGAPMVAVRHLARRPRWVSLPFTDYCPPLAESPTEESALSLGLVAASREAGLASVELRGPLHGAEPAGPPAVMT